MSTRMRLRERIKRVSKPSGARIVEEVSRRYGGKDDDDGDEEPIKARRRLLFSTGKGKEEADVDADDPILDDDPEDEDWDDNNNRRKSSKKHVDEIEDDDVVLVGPSHSARDQDVFDDDAGPVRAGKRPLVSPAPQIAPAPAAPAKKKADENYKKAMKRPRPRAPSQWKEQQVTIDDRYKVVKTNKIYIESLIVSLQYLDSIEPADQILRDRDAIRVALVEAVKIQVRANFFFFLFSFFFLNFTERVGAREKRRSYATSGPSRHPSGGRNRGALHKRCQFYGDSLERSP